jgi:hypothetical protein
VSVHWTISLILGCKKNLQEKDESLDVVVVYFLSYPGRLKNEEGEFGFSHYGERILIRENPILSPFHRHQYFTSWTN